MVVPESPLLEVKSLVVIRSDHVLNAANTSVLFGTVVEDSLPHLICKVGAVVIGLDEA